ncbi:hypothetical protein [Clostridium sp. Cult1]|uniref:hypothetical protein n=1 Tax=Clostridium sp. Cult1 TaxID=2079002 RepID=UPI001F287D23|nr:hypothetical protein [Clostridium sp. Cult1]MCF6462646.1 hypothetical protein [Clostridium sp. Cult1]
MSNKHEGRINNIKKLIEKFTVIIEVLLALLIILIVILSIKDLLVLGKVIFTTEADASYEILQGFLSHTLLLVVGLELAIMLISHTPGKVLQVILYAIARKMLVSSVNMADILLGVIALAIIFITDKYFHTREEKKIL